MIPNYTGFNVRSKKSGFERGESYKRLSLIPLRYKG